LDDPLAVVNMLHEVLVGAGLHADLGLPQIAVVGSQSVGKTSVLQSLVGRNFLPRGAGIVTRRPLVLQLRNTNALGSPEQTQHGGAALSGALQHGHSECSRASRTPHEDPPGHEADGVSSRGWVEFEHRRGERLSFADVCQEITAETERVCGSSHAVSDEPILLRIFSPGVTDLTLVDLPGLTKVPTGDQPADIADRIRSLVMRYISQPSCIILAVSAANADLATSDALALAREADPAGDRTLGVLTKLDLAGEAQGAVEALQGRLYPLRLGYAGVVCGGEAAGFDAALAAERDFFERSREFRQVSERCGIPHLARRMHDLLLDHIRRALPDLRARLQRIVEEHRAELEAFGDPELLNRMGQGPFLLHLLSGYVRNFSDALDGRSASYHQEAMPDKLVGGARLHHIFHQIFLKAILDFGAFSGMPDVEIRLAMRNAAGTKPQLFVPEVAFEALVKRQIQKLEEPSLQCVHLVYEELKQLASQSEDAEMQRFPGLREKVLEVVHGVVRRCVQPTSQMVSNLIRIELAHINVSHPDFIGGHRAMSEAFQAAHGRVAGERSPGRAELPVGAATAAVEAPPSARDVKQSAAEWPRSQWGRKGSREDESLRLPAVPTVVAPSEVPTGKELMDTQLLKSLLSSYFEIVKRKIVDAVPKTIMHFMVNAVRDSLHHECIAEVYKSELFASLLSEAEEVQRQRLRLNRRLEELRRAQDMLAQVRDAAIHSSV